MGTAEPATIGEELDAIASGSSNEAGEHKGQINDGLTLPSVDSGAGMFSKLILFAIIVGIVAIVIKSRKSGSGALSEKSLA